MMTYCVCFSLPLNNSRTVYVQLCLSDRVYEVLFECLRYLTAFEHAGFNLVLTGKVEIWDEVCFSGG